MSDQDMHTYRNPVLLGALTACFLVSLLPVVHIPFFQDIDVNVLILINLSRIHSLDAFFNLVTDTAGAVGMLTPLILLCIPRLRKAGVYGLIAYLATALTSNALKYILNRPRPFATYHFIEKMTSGGSPSFPSGHTTDAFVTAGVLSLVFRRWYVTVVVYLWAILVAYSRIDLGVHYPSDVLAGAALGSIAAVVCYGVEGWLIRKREAF
ncbi:phosphatase PAP2 family protein [Chitinophaga agrisoli]|nr:phosphatase PAP2 family protein [Chitinophaga agrisoli]